MICQRCGKEALAHITSMFNTQIICIDCKEKERQHPLYEKAVAADTAAIRQGDYNFPGIGKPEDL